MLRELSVNLIASALFLLLLCWLMRPRLRIASMIVEHLDQLCALGANRDFTEIEFK